MLPSSHEGSANIGQRNSGHLAVPKLPGAHHTGGTVLSDLPLRTPQIPLWGGSAPRLLPKPDTKKDKNEPRSDCRHHPNGTPVMYSPACGRHFRVQVHDPAGQVGPQKHHDSVGDKGDESLRSGAQRRGGFLVDVHLSGHKEKVIANSVKDDSEIEHPDQVAAVSESEKQVSQDPREHSKHERVLHAE